MRRIIFLFGVVVLAADASAIVLSTGAINDYGGSANLSHDIAEAKTE